MSSTQVAPETAAALLATVRRASGCPDLAYADPPVSLQGGYYAEMIRFGLAGAPAELRGDLVARIVPNPATARWEAVLQGGVAGQGFPTPVVRLTADDTSPLGRSLLVMDHVEGAPMLSGLDGARIVGQIPAILRHLPDQLAGLAAALHAVDPDAVAAGLDALDDGIPTTTRGFLEAQLWSAAVAGRPDLAEVAEQLIATEPASRRRVISHGDLHPFNVLEASAGPVLIDWTVARVAHPGFTLGFTDLMLSHPPVEAPRAAAPVLRAVGRRLTRRFHRTYRSLAAPADLVTPEELGWFRKVHELRIVVELAGWEAAGTMPTSHPWLLMRPIADRDLGLPRR
ncbi:phosphotransferase family protein [Aquihabitans daechungensis]|uniref:phosphotransferase family protein n=1 Tax=Aquihabitans daechungensis TaxID=1052257 RepID=UPI003B9E4671